MKKIIFIGALVLLFQGVKAQEEISLNHFILGGSMNLLVQNNSYPLSIVSIGSGLGGIYSNNANDTKNTTFAITPHFGKEINPHLILGLQLDYRRGKFKSDDTFVFGQQNPVDFERNSNKFGVGVFSRHTLNPGNQFNLYIQPYVEYNLLREEESQNSNVTQEERADYIELGIGAGVLYNINDKMRALLRIGGIGYVNGKWEIIGTDTEKEFSSLGANINLSTIYFGFEIRI